MKPGAAKLENSAMCDVVDAARSLPSRYHQEAACSALYPFRCIRCCPNEHGSSLRYNKNGETVLRFRVTV